LPAFTVNRLYKDFYLARNLFRVGNSGISAQDFSYPHRMSQNKYKAPGYHSLSDEELLDEYRKSGNRETIGILFKRYSHLVFGVCMHFLYNKEKAADAVMGIFEQLFESVSRHQVTNFKAWISTVSKNYCLMQLRKSSAKCLVLLDDIEKFSDQHMENEHLLHHDTDDTDDILETLLNSVSALNNHQQQCIRLFYLESHSYQEVATLTGLNLGEVKSHIQNGKRKLKLFIEGKKKI
jgi:RNA polymerase sigma factor (sigma-70 family)